MNKFVGVEEICKSDGVICPKPRRLPSLLQINNQEMEGCDLKAGADLLDIILTKGRYDDNSNFQLDSSPPFFSGSPPSRTTNPLIQDVHFRKGNFIPIPQIQESSAAAPSPPLFSSSGRITGGGCVRVKFANKSAPVRIEGFNCRGSCSISAVA